MANIITVVEDEIKAGWDYIQQKATDVYNFFSPLVAEPLKVFEQVVIQDLWGAAAAFITKVTDTLRAVSLQAALVDLETAFLNTIEHLWPNLLSAAQALGSQLLQLLLGTLQAKALAA